MWVKKALMSCRNATVLIEKKKLTGLDLIEKIELKLHLTACKYCNQYKVQDQLIDEFMKDLEEVAEFKAAEAPELSADFKHKMKILINSRLNDK
ncbi:MAG: hypothetical protein NVSMB24_27150 [Mucilaginibacter sp.]